MAEKCSIWQWYADEADHYSLVRQVNDLKTYEVVRVTHGKHGEASEFLHQFFFLAEYTDKELLEILNSFESCTSLEEFRKQTGCGNSEEMYWLIASLLAEHFEGRKVSRERADQLVKAITGI